ncbi:MAG: peptidyl-prolyl cis-trans isomerase, partial [Candidatus Sumerlaeota bacterium]|nr:peptidyl-prolyl cis-trans isomerase [Candidatus Sumerlaeota bacterium]
GESTFAWFRSPSSLPWPINRWTPVTRVEMLLAGEALKSRRETEATVFGGLPRQYLPQGRPTELFTTAEILREALNQRIIRQTAKDLGITVTQADLQDIIRRRFPQSTREMFANYLYMRGVSEEQYLSELTDEVYNIKVMQMFADQAKASLFELWQEYTLHKEKLQLNYVMLLASNYANSVAVDEADLQKYFDEHKEAYRVPDQRQYRYIAVSQDQIKGETQVTPDEAQAFYTENVETYPLFRTQPKMHLRMILIQYPAAEGMKDEEKRAAAQKAREHADEVDKEAKDGKTDFAELANRVSEDEKNKETAADSQATLQGGDIGWVEADDTAEWGDAFINAAFKLAQDGDVSDVVAGTKGYCILKREGYQESQPIPFEQVSDLARDAALSKKVREDLKKREQAMRDAAKEFTSLDGIAKQLGYEIKQTDLINADEPVIDRGVGSLYNDREYLAGLDPGETSSVLSTDQGAIILSIAKAVPSRLPELAEVRDKAEVDYRDTRALEMAEAGAAEGEKQAQTPEGLEAWAGGEGLQVQTTEFFARDSAPPGISEKIDGFDTQTYKTPVGAVRKSPLSSGGARMGWIVWRIKDLQMPSKEEFAKDYLTFQRQMVFTKMWALYEEWLADQRLKWKVRLPQENA